MPDITQFFIAQAWAQTVPTAAGGGSSSSAIMPFLPMVLIFVVIYIFLIRPQQKKFEQHKSMIKALRRGDRVVTGGGIVGIVTKLEGDDILVVEIAEDVRVKVQRSTITSLSAKTEPVTPSNDDEGGKPA